MMWSENYLLQINSCVSDLSGHGADGNEAARLVGAGVKVQPLDAQGKCTKHDVVVHKHVVDRFIVTCS